MSNEDTQHLFFRCSYSEACLKEVKSWCNWKTGKTDLMELMKWIEKRKKKTKVYRSISYAMLAACVYHIWRIRNEVLWTQKVRIVSNTVQNIKRDICNRLIVSLPKKTNSCDRMWIEKLCKKS